MTALTWTLTALSLLGVWLNIRKRTCCFVVWMISNVGWAVLDWQHGLPAQAALQATYFGMSLWGLLRWRAESRDAAAVPEPR